MSEVTRILDAIEQGDRRAIDRLLPAVYQELRQLAAQKLAREKPGQTLQATALVHEVYLRLVATEDRTWRSGTHFFAAAAEAMRRILVENARRKRCLKRCSGRQRIDVDEGQLAVEGPSEYILALDEALPKLAEVNPTVADLVRLRYFAGLTLDQAAELLGVSRRTTDRYWAFAKAWLYKRITEGETGDLHEDTAGGS
jgi:RNA polymerase sigma factor (TIGR02999 family)